MRSCVTMQKCCQSLIVLILIASSFVGGQVAWALSTNDPHFQQQTHLNQIRAEKAWGVVNSNTSIKIAVLDSGVDFTHPDLKDNLLPGINLHPESSSYQDDNGHGTQVIGILAARGNNGVGVSGVMWNARVLPIKVLNKDGRTTAEILAKGIHTAIDQGAKIILMSVTNLYPSGLLEQAVKRAEDNGVIIVAAAGNESSQVGYPAAYPTVIAVGAVDHQNKPMFQSNGGPELNIVAPGWSVYTTKRGGTYGTFKGTSAAAPQVAAAAALILAKNPQFKPIDVRQQLYGTTTEIGGRRWNERSGYGLLNIDAAVRRLPNQDIHEPNNIQSQAAPFPIESQLRAALDNQDQLDWYYIDVPYDGKITFQVQVSSNQPSALAATFYNHGTPATYYVGNGNTLTVQAKAGRQYLKMERVDNTGAYTYVLTNRFYINPDRYEENNEQRSARALPNSNKISIIGNFHRAEDVDWFSYYVREYGKITVTVTADTHRIDPVLYFAKEREAGQTIDNSSGTNTREQLSMEVTPGRYYIRVNDYWNNAVNGEYRLDLDYTPELKDSNEPNDNYLQATRLGTSTVMTGTLPTTYDYDWFHFQLREEAYVVIHAPHIPVKSGMRFALYKADRTITQLSSINTVAEISARGESLISQKLQAGEYYVRLHSTVPFRYDMYRVHLSVQKLTDGYRDISSHWARTDIARLSRLGIVNGFSDATFRPEQTVTRAEFASMLMRALEHKGLHSSQPGPSNPFRDITRSHWAYNNILRAYNLGIMQGYPNGLIRPNQPVTRAEMAVMVSRAQNIYTFKPRFSSYRDVSVNHWASPAIEALTSRGYISGVGQRQFKPEANTRRAEAVVLIRKAFQL